ncbi:hypothetical protein GCM10010433_06610 [Streptomyces pulveraceus]
MRGAVGDEAGTRQRTAGASRVQPVQQPVQIAGLPPVGVRLRAQDGARLHRGEVERVQQKAVGPHHLDLVRVRRLGREVLHVRRDDGMRLSPYRRRQHMPVLGVVRHGGYERKDAGGPERLVALGLGRSQQGVPDVVREEDAGVQDDALHLAPVGSRGFG